MNKTVARCTMIVAAAAWIVLSVAEPWVLGDNNIFLKEFVNHEVLNFLGIIVAITLASAANLHLEFNRIEREAGRAFLVKTRAAVKKSAFGLIAMLFVGVVLVVVKPLVGTSAIGSSLINGGTLLIILANILVLIDITQLVFRIEASIEG